MYYPRIKYEFVNNFTGQVYKLENDPRGWDDSERNIKRSVKNFSVVREYSKNLEFVKKDAKALSEYYSAYDIEADITLIEYKIIPNTTKEEYYIHTKGELDFSEYSKKDNVVKVPFATGGLDKELTAQMSEKFNLTRLTSINGDELEAINKIRAELVSREIFLISKLAVNDDVDDSDKPSFIPEGISYFASTEPANAWVFRQAMVSNSDQANIQPVYGDPVIPFANAVFERENFFYYNSDLAKTVRVTLTYEDLLGRRSYGTKEKYTIKLFVYNLNNGSLSFISSDTLVATDWIDSGEPISGEVAIAKDLNEGDSMLIQFDFQSGFDTITSTGQTITMRKFEIGVTEDSVTPKTVADAIFMHDAFERLCQIITGRSGVFYSEALGRTAIGYNEDGEYAFNAVTLGLWIRGFLEKNFELSLKDALESSDAMQTLTYSIYEMGGKEKLVLEPVSFFFQPTTVIDLGEISDLEEEPAMEFYYRGLEIGYKKPDGDRLYEEAMGLDEFNVKNTWTLPITRTEDTFVKVSDIRNDGYGKAFASRKPALNFPEEDTQYDKDIFHLDLKEGLGKAYIEKTWQDYYDTQPTGVYSPDTATGLNFTPYRMLERHEFLFSASLANQNFQSKYIRFASSTGNSNLVTKKAGEEARAENGDKLISETKNTNFYPKWFKFKREVDYQLSILLDGFTEVNGRNIPNIFFKVKFTYRNQNYYGYIFEVKPNKEGDWKLLKAY